MLAAGVIEDASLFPRHSLWAEWGYVIDLDTRRLEVYRGCPRRPHRDGRFASDTPDTHGYYPVRLVASWPLTRLPADADFLAALKEG